MSICIFYEHSILMLDINQEANLGSKNCTEKKGQCVRSVMYLYFLIISFTTVLPLFVKGDFYMP